MPDFAKQLALQMAQAALMAVMGVLIKELAGRLHQHFDLHNESWR